MREHKLCRTGITGTLIILVNKKVAKFSPCDEMRRLYIVLFSAWTCFAASVKEEQEEELHTSPHAAAAQAYEGYLAW